MTAGLVPDGWIQQLDGFFWVGLLAQPLDPNLFVLWSHGYGKERSNHKTTTILLFAHFQSVGTNPKRACLSWPIFYNPPDSIANKLDRFLFSFQAIGTPSFAETVPNITVVAGKDVILPCVVDNLEHFKVAWVRVDTQTILTIHTKV